MRSLRGKGGEGSARQGSDVRGTGAYRLFLGQERGEGDRVPSGEICIESSRES